MNGAIRLVIKVVVYLVIVFPVVIGIVGSLFGNGIVADYSRRGRPCGLA